MLSDVMHADQGSTAAQRVAVIAYDYDAEAKEGPVPCNLCAAPGRPLEVAGRDRYGYRATCVICRSCGLGYLSPRLTPAGYARFYAGVYRPLVSAYHGRRIDAQTVQHEQHDYADTLAAFLVPLLGVAPRTVLDVGGSTGVVAGVLAARLGARATVLDPAPDELAVAAAAGMETIGGMAEAFDPGDRRWDLVLLCQTIDHLLDVRATLAALRRVTASQGHAFVDILDLGLMLSREGAIERVVKIDHPYYLTRATAVAFFALSGYRVVAERTSEDGHRGFLLRPCAPAEPDWLALKAAAMTSLTAR